MKSVLRIAALALMAALLCLLPACGGDGSADTTAPDTTAAPETTAAPTPLALVTGGVSEYAIVRPETADDEVVDAAIALYSAFTQAGVRITITTDWEKAGADPSTRPKYEILVGHTNREETETVASRLLYDDYAVEVVGDKLVICGGGDAATAAACNWFVGQYLSGKVTDLSLERTLLHSKVDSSYPVTAITLGGKAIQDYTIAYTSSVYNDAALELQQGIIDACGRVLPVVALRNGAAPMIIVGMPESVDVIAPCTGEKVFALSRDSMDHAIEQKDGTLVLAGFTAWTASDAVGEFLATYLAGKTGEVAVGEISLLSEMTASEPLYKEATMRIMTYNVLGVADNHLDRYPYVIAQIRRYLPDILGMQESPKTVHSQVIDAVSDVYAEAHKWHDGGDIVNYTPILYRKDKYKVLEADCVFLRSRYTGTNTKSICWAVFETIETGERFIVTNLHGSLISASYNIPGSNSVEGAAWRVDNVAQMVEKLTELKAKYGDLPTFSTGDFNFNEDAQAYKDAVAAGLSDAEKIATVSRVSGIKTTHTVGQAPASGKSIDHIFVNDKVSVYVQEVVRDAEALKGSDHCAVYADVKLGK